MDIVCAKCGKEVHFSFSPQTGNIIVIPCSCVSLCLDNAYTVVCNTCGCSLTYSLTERKVLHVNYCTRCAERSEIENLARKEGDKVQSGDPTMQAVIMRLVDRNKVLENIVAKIADIDHKLEDV